MNSNPDHLEEAVLNEYLDRALLPEEASAVEAHLAACAACAGRLEELRSLFYALQQLPVEPLRQPLAGMVLARLRRRREQESRSPAGLWAVLVAEALAGLALLALAWPALAARLHSLGWALSGLVDIPAGLPARVLAGWGALVRQPETWLGRLPTPALTPAQWAAVLVLLGLALVLATRAGLRDRPADLERPSRPLARRR